MIELARPCRLVRGLAQRRIVSIMLKSTLKILRANLGLARFLHRTDQILATREALD
jgi:hypothetical protein